MTPNPYDAPGDLLKETLRRLKNCGMSLDDVAKVTNLPRDWLGKLSAGQIQNPSVNRIEYLYDFLGGPHDPSSPK